MAEVDDFGARVGVALVTGGSGGLGRAICRLLAARGSDIAFTYRANAASANALLDDIVTAGRKASARAVNLSDIGAARAFVDESASEYGGIHTLVHAAGPEVRQLYITSASPEQVRESLDQEVVGFFAVAQPAVPHLRARRGNIVAVTTAATRRYPVRDGLSAGPKAAVEGLVRAIAAEEGRYGVRANCVGPGMLTDGMAERLIASGELHEAALDVARRAIALHTFGDASDIAEAVCFLASDRAKYITGQHLSVDGGYGI
jgi:NAD(P)-dependent dehydrogenase (short-subunit alcohol dehydrogenase family)